MLTSSRKEAKWEPEKQRTQRGQRLWHGFWICWNWLQIFFLTRWDTNVWQDFGCPGLLCYTKNVIIAKDQFQCTEVCHWISFTICSHKNEKAVRASVGSQRPTAVCGWPGPASLPPAPGPHRQGSLPPGMHGQAGLGHNGLGSPTAVEKLGPESTPGWGELSWWRGLT